FSTPIRIRAAGRTDAGVHALGQVAAFSIPREFEAGALQRALNAILPRDIVILGAEPASDSFDPRRDALSRIYEYRILNRFSPSAFEHWRSWHIRETLDLGAMNAAAARFIGEHDFAAFRTLGTEMRSTVRRVIESRWRREGDFAIYHVEATSFVRHMVRTMVAAMVDIGRGKCGPDAIDRILASRDRALAPAAAPASGLYLVAVRY
ncbi:MAG TPA: tRNA pseudouridine(38-40) synthase TruA, partial [Candidatus Binataceae bacterium]|nr:tRNA pseudouridine(38-40) synthase TruA [Candidatus Binataceae bacterium]